MPFFGFRFLGKQEREQMLTMEVTLIGRGVAPNPLWAVDQLLFFVRKKSNQKNSPLENPLTVRLVEWAKF